MEEECVFNIDRAEGELIRTGCLWADVHTHRERGGEKGENKPSRKLGFRMDPLPFDRKSIFRLVAKTSEQKVLGGFSKALFIVVLNPFFFLAL